MDWVQFLTMTLTIIATTVGCCVYFHQIHRQDMYRMDTKWEKLFERMDIKLSEVDSKWERLFERMDAKISGVDTKWEKLFERLLDKGRL